MTLLVDCAIPHYTVRVFDSGCWGCGRTLTGRQRKWCDRRGSDGVLCKDRWAVNHEWNYARSQAITAACVKQHRHTGSRRYDPCLPACAACGEPTDEPQVDHTEPMDGDKRTGHDCRNHQSKLQVLDHDCHVSVTNRRRP